MSGPLVFALRAILAATLYLFLAWALLTLWRDLKGQAALLASRKIPHLSLTIRSDASGSKVRLFQQPEVIVGRDPTCDCLLDEDSISARHARFSYHHEQWWLEDLASTNGTFLNNAKLDTPTVVITGDELRAGEVCLVIAIAGDVSLPPAEESPAHEKE
jgi:predicted component of type VI protein secretion system